MVMVTDLCLYYDPYKVRRHWETRCWVFLARNRIIPWRTSSRHSRCWRDVPKNDALNTVQELTGWIESIVELADDLRLDHAYAVLRMFDETAQQFVRKLLRDYFTFQSQSKFQENRLWMVLNGFYTQVELVSLRNIDPLPQWRARRVRHQAGIGNIECARHSGLDRAFENGRSALRVGRVCAVATPVRVLWSCRDERLSERCGAAIRGRGRQYFGDAGIYRLC